MVSLDSVPQDLLGCTTWGWWVKQMMSRNHSETANGMGYYQKESDRVLAPAPVPDGEEPARRKEHDGHGDSLAHRVNARSVVRDGELHVKITKVDGGRNPGAFANGEVLTYHEWAQSGYRLESTMDRCSECGKICSVEYQNPGGCVFCNHPALQGDA